MSGKAKAPKAKGGKAKGGKAKGKNKSKNNSLVGQRRQTQLPHWPGALGICVTRDRPTKQEKKKKDKSSAAKQEKRKVEKSAAKQEKKKKRKDESSASSKASSASSKASSASSSAVSEKTKKKEKKIKAAKSKEKGREKTKTKGKGGAKTETRRKGEGKSESKEKGGGKKESKGEGGKKKSSKGKEKRKSKEEKKKKPSKTKKGKKSKKKAPSVISHVSQISTRVLEQITGGPYKSDKSASPSATSVSGSTRVSSESSFTKYYKAALNEVQKLNAKKEDKDKSQAKDAKSVTSIATPKSGATGATSTVIMAIGEKSAGTSAITLPSGSTSAASTVPSEAKPHGLAEVGMFRWKKFCNASKLLPFALTTVVTLAVFTFLETSYDERWYYKPVSECNFTSDLEQETVEMADKIQQILEKNRVTYFLCRGSLWGILRIQKLQPWDKELDICVLHAEWTLVDAGYMYRQFRWEQLGLSYNGRRGVYEIRYGQGKANIIFYDWVDSNKEWLQRIGWENWIFQNWRNRKIPAKLIESPLPHVKFYQLKFPVPHSGIELQKYLYPNDWWREVKPPGC